MTNVRSHVYRAGNKKKAYMYNILPANSICRQISLSVDSVKSGEEFLSWLRTKGLPIQTKREPFSDANWALIPYWRKSAYATCNWLWRKIYRPERTVKLLAQLNSRSCRPPLAQKSWILPSLIKPCDMLHKSYEVGPISAQCALRFTFFVVLFYWFTILISHDHLARRDIVPNPRKRKPNQ